MTYLSDEELNAKLAARRALPKPQQFPKATRLEVIDDSGRAFVAYYPKGGIEVHSQDDGRTVKVFAGAPGSVDDIVWDSTAWVDSMRAHDENDPRV